MRYTSAIGGKFISLTPGANRLLISATIEGNQKGGTILLSVRTSQLVVGITGATHQPSYPPPKVASVAVRKIWSAFDNQIRNSVEPPLALPVAPNAGPLATGVEQRQRDLAKKAEEDQVKLKQAEQALFADWRNCLFDSVRGLATISGESAEVIVKATYAACRPQRQKVVEFHTSYGDSSFSRIIDEVERRVAGDLMLEVLQVRAMKLAPPPTMPPPTRPPSPRPKEHAI